jgi:predicted NAD/FAD-dependent oxidoreductase
MRGTFVALCGGIGGLFAANALIAQGLSVLVCERLRRERVAEIQQGARRNGLRVDSAATDLKVRDAGLVAHAVCSVFVISSASRRTVVSAASPGRARTRCFPSIRIGAIAGEH